MHPSRVSEFVAAYRPDGDWARLFKLAPGFGGTELLSSSENVGRFVTIDRWDHADDYIRFQANYGARYRDLDVQLEGLTIAESKLGSYTLVT